MGGSVLLAAASLGTSWSFGDVALWSGVALAALGLIIGLQRALWVVVDVLVNSDSANVGPRRYAARQGFGQSAQVDVAWPVYWPVQARADIGAVISRFGTSWHRQTAPLHNAIRRSVWPIKLVLAPVALVFDVAAWIAYVAVATVHAAATLIVGSLVGAVSLLFREFVALWERATLRRRSAAAACHAPECYGVFPRAAYVCPTCDARHRDIRPSRMGGLWRRCGCNTALPTTALRASRSHDARCQRCDELLTPRSGALRTIRLATLGGPSAGKSAWVYASVGSYMARAGTKHRHAAIPNSERREGVEAAYRTVQSRRALENDHSALPEGLTIEVGLGGRASLVQLFDASGEQMADHAVRDELAYFYDAHCLVFALDALSIPAVAEQLGSENVQGASPEHPEVAYQQVVNRLRDSGVDVGAQLLAVVVTKSDVLHDAGIELPPDSEGISEWLRSVGLSNLVNGASMAFEKVGWFAAAATGPLPQGSAYNAARPLDWLLRESGAGSIFRHAARSGGSR